MDEYDVVEVALTPQPEPAKRSRVWVMGGGVLLVAALLFGAYAATSDDDSKVDVAAVDDDVAETVSDESDEPISPTTTNLTGPVSVDGDEPASAGSDEVSRDDAGFAVAEDAAFFGGGPDGVIFDGEQFIAIGYSEDGQTLRTSTDGVTWNERAFPGLPDNSHVYQLAQHDGTVVAVVEQWSSRDEEEPTDIVEQYFGPGEGGPTHFLASTTDLDEWMLTELPAPPATSDGARLFRSVNGVAIGDSGVVLMTQVHPNGPNEMRILFDAGILGPDDLERYCGINFEDDDTYVVQLCNFEEDEGLWEEFERAMDEAESDEERAEIERTFEERFIEPEPEIIATIAAGDPLHDELSVIFTDDGYEATNTVLYGSPTGPFSQANVSSSGYPVGVVEVDGTFVSLIQDWSEDRGSVVVLTSNDGSAWTEAGALGSPNGGQLFSVGSSLVVLGGDESGTPLSFVSTDAGATWAPAGLTTALFGAYPQAASGPAGIAVVLQGATEPYPDYPEPSPLVVTKNGYTLTITYSNEEPGRVVLTDADGAVIHSISEEEMYSGEGGLEGVVRVSRLTGTPTFLDPETGEDLVSFTNQDYEEAYGEVELDEPQEEIGFASEYLFSVDGVSWTTIDDPRLDIDVMSGNIQIVAVGDDEVIFAHHTWVEPPMELFAFEEEGREPTDAEAQALDQWFSTNGRDNAVDYIRIEVG